MGGRICAPAPDTAQSGISLKGYRPPGARCEIDVQVAHLTHNTGDPGWFRARREFKIGNALQQDLRRYFELHFRQIRTDAKMRPNTERDVPVRLPLDIQFRGVLEYLRVPVCRCP